MTELRALTSARGVAAWMVVLYHIRESIAGLPTAALHVFAKGYLAVDFFFLLSGFVMALTWADRLRAHPREVGRFLQKRVARVWPLHLLMLAGAVGLAALLQATGRADPVSYPWGELPLHVLLLQNWGLTHHLSWNDPSWSISAELGAYLLFPLLTMAVDWKRVPSWAVVAAIAALCLLLDAAMTLRGAPTLGWDISRFGLLRCVMEFAAGGAVAALWTRWQGSGMRMAQAFAVSAALLLGWALGAPELLVVPGAFAALLLGLALSCGRAGNALEVRWLHWLGDVSYATYLGHFLLWRLFKLAFVREAGAVAPWQVALYLLAVLVSSAILYRWFEKPAQAWVNTLRFPSILPRQGEVAPKATEGAEVSR